uniref:Uncharacterized protein n=1 Tax=Coccidioides posadasii RMSCC 3488 TaxID=454284 RepID=A0A0J6F7X7_COCPO|nr:hypothetical protein CPAG_01391 [Coccidioides posadasii RMSCC 3488]
MKTDGKTLIVELVIKSQGVALRQKDEDKKSREKEVKPQYQDFRSRRTSTNSINRKKKKQETGSSGEQDDHQMPVILEIQGAYSFGEEIYWVGSHDIGWGWQETHIHKSTTSVLLDTKGGIICAGRTE